MDYFYPRSPCGERQLAARDESIMFVFLSTLSLRRATENSLCQIVNSSISIHALLAESDDTPSTSIPKPGISIHALLAESDANGGAPSSCFVISIHALLAESDSKYHRILLQHSVFLSTLSLRRATLAVQLGCKSFLFLSTLSLRRATL